MGAIIAVVVVVLMLLFVWPGWIVDPFEDDAPEEEFGEGFIDADEVDEMIKKFKNVSGTGYMDLRRDEITRSTRSAQDFYRKKGKKGAKIDLTSKKGKLTGAQYHEALQEKVARDSSLGEGRHEAYLAKNHLAFKKNLSDMQIHEATSDAPYLGTRHAHHQKTVPKDEHHQVAHQHGDNHAAQPLHYTVPIQKKKE